MDRFEEIKHAWLALKVMLDYADFARAEGEWLISEVESLRIKVETAHTAFMEACEQREKLEQQLADSQEHAQAEQDRADSHWKKVERLQEQLAQMKETLYADTGKE